MSHETAEQRKSRKAAAKRDVEVKYINSSNVEERPPDHTQLIHWLYETKRDKLTMAEILEQRKREAISGSRQ